MKICIFSSWNIRCGIFNYTSHVKEALESLQPPVEVQIVPFDRKPHSREEYMQWGRQMNAGDVAHIQFDYSFFRYLLPWQNTFPAFVSQIQKPLIITRHVSFDGKLNLTSKNARALVHQAKWKLYQTKANPYATYLNKTLFDVADQLIVLSTHVRDQLLARGYPADKINVLPPGVPPVKMAPPEAVHAARARWDAEGWAGKTVLGNFGYVGVTKGLPIIAQALVQLPENVVLLIGGGVREPEHQPALDAFMDEVRRLRLEPRVKVTGYLDDDALAAQGSAVDLHVYAHTRAEFSYTVTTAMALKAAPIIASDIAAHAELARNGAGIRLFRNKDPNDLARVIRETLADAAGSRAMLQQFDAYIQNHTWKRIAQRTLGVYLKAMEHHRKRTMPVL
jgi:glycosyltransferase involved in cell wall biosynthesis